MAPTGSDANAGTSAAPWRTIQKAANTLNGGEVVDDASVERVLPQLKLFFTRLGFMEQSSADLFQQYLRRPADQGAVEAQVAGVATDVVAVGLAHHHLGAGGAPRHTHQPHNCNCRRDNHHSHGSGFHLFSFACFPSLNLRRRPD